MNGGSTIGPDQRDEVRKEVRAHMAIAAAVLFLLALAVAVSFMDLETRQAVVIVLGIAGVQAFLIAGLLMHAAGERRTVHLLLAITGVLLAALMVLTSGALRDSYGEAVQTPSAAAHLEGVGDR